MAGAGVRFTKCWQLALFLEQQRTGLTDRSARTKINNAVPIQFSVDG